MSEKNQGEGVFLPCDAMRCTIFVIVIVCLSVRLSVTLVHCVMHMVRPTIMISSPYGSPNWRYHVHPKIRRGSHRSRALNEGGVGTNWRFSTNKPPYLRNGARYDKYYYWSLIGNQYSLSIGTKINDLGWPWNDLGRQLCTPLHYTCVSEPTTKMCMKIDPYYQRQKCSPGILVSSKISFMQTFAGVRWRGGVKWEWGVKNGDFRFFRSLCLPNLHI